MEDLPDVRLRARPVRCVRRHHAFALHARVRGSPTAVRLVPRPARTRAQTQADRVLASQSRVCTHQQAQAEPARRGRTGQRLGRPAAGDTHRHASPRLPGACRQGLHIPRRRDQERQRHRDERARKQRARIFRSRGRTPHGRLKTAQGRADELPRRPDRDDDGAESSEPRGTRHEGNAVRARDLHRTKRLHGRCAQEVLPPQTGRRGSLAFRLHHSLRRSNQGRCRRGRRVTLQLRPGYQKRQCRRAAQGQRHDSLGRG